MRCLIEVVLVLLCMWCTRVRTDGEDITTAITTINSHSTETGETDSFSETTAKASPTTSEVTHDIIITSEPITPEQKTTNGIVETTEPQTTEYVSTSTDSPETTTAAKPSACSKTPCKNNGSCSDDDATAFVCVCPEGYVGARCQVTDLCVPSDDHTLCKNGGCAYASDGLSRSCVCFYGTFWDAERKECAEIPPPCVPCHNGGTCQVEGDGFSCACPSGFEGTLCDIVNECGNGDICPNGKCVTTTTGNSKRCECDRNFFWNPDSRECEAEEAPCKPNPCRNSGVCESISASDFNCTCPGRYRGKTCDITDFCSVGGEKKNNSTKEEECERGKCVESEGVRKCSCDDGFYLDEDSQTCEERMPPCQPNPCKNDGICSAVDRQEFNCSCSDGFTGRTCSDKDFCVLLGGRAFCGWEAVCRNDAQSATFFCSCENGSYFDYVSRTCAKIDFCPVMTCKENEECVNSKCDCVHNAEWNNSTGKCEVSYCSSNPCPVEDMVCSEGEKGYECACAKGKSFNGERCIAESLCHFPTLNSCEQECRDTEDGYECDCYSDDFQLNEDNTTCTYTGNSTCSNLTCSTGICVGGDIEICVCPPGFTVKDGQCKDLCSAGELPEDLCPDNKCESTSSGFRCKCEGKYKLSEDKTTCTARKMCEFAEAGWNECSSREAICIDDWPSAAGYKCSCPDGFVETEDGVCRDVCSIEENQRICSMFGAKCDIDDGGNRTCRCPPYFHPFEEGKVCNKRALHSYLLSLPLNPDIYERTTVAVRTRRQANPAYYVDYKHVKRDVQEAISLVLPGILHVNVLNYVRDKNFLLCKVEMQFRSALSEDLKRLSAPDLCKPSPESSTSCLLSPSLVLQKDYVRDFLSVRKTDPCDDDLKDSLCETETSCYSSTDGMSFNCSCKPGFAVRNKVYPFGSTKSSIESCRDIDECSLGNPCFQNMKCENTFGSYKCSCRPGYRTDKDSSSQKCVGMCNPNPCLNGECSAVSDNDFQCRCDAGYRGSLCDMQDENFKRARTNTIIVGAVLGGALLVTLIISFSVISKLKRKKSIDAPDQIRYGTEMAERRNIASGAVNNAYQRD